MGQACADNYRNWKGWSEDNFGILDTADERYFEAEMRISGVSVASGTRILEIGFGNGQFAAWATKRGTRYIGTEIDSHLVERAKRIGIDARAATPDLRDLGIERVDCVVLFDVLEHLTPDQAVELLTTARSLLTATGRIVIRVPSGDSPFSRSIQHGDRTHKATIGSGIARQYGQAAELRVLQIRPPAFPVVGLGVRRFFRRGLVLMGRWVVAKFVNTVFHDNQPRVIAPNMVVVFALAAESSAASILG